ncbi:hypothetical protein GCM10009841_06890 [Microlunatus panaciterrae]|uniref:Thiol-disulfide isomerase/thioredoxin n=1 Tax=Microlunatus panaciterrae TaxID=400768 RepID=A0ABS2RI39_9ACTN|nr:thioredoxin family protein [Microlunatus panaciterrae]MBM7798658.1 thiol-disulfide isomerase/thioredoxin [Microlunatus panaciterrae]
MSDAQDPAVGRSYADGVLVGVVVLAVVVTFVGVFSLYRRSTDGVFATGRTPTTPPTAAVDPGLAPPAAAQDELGLVEPDREIIVEGEVGEQLGERATVLQFSSAFCAPCRTTRVLVSAATADLAGIAHIELDAEAHLDLVRRLRIVRTPTVLILNRAGVVVNRAQGVPKRAELLAALGAAVG